MQSTESVSTGPIADRSVSLLVEVDALEMPIVALFGQPRRHWLRARESRVAYVRDTSKKLRNAVVHPVRMLLACAFADLDDGAPLAAVLQPWYAVIDLLRARWAVRMRTKGQSWELRYALVTDRETDAESKLTKAQMRARANPNDPEALREQRAAMREYRGVMDEMDALLDERVSR